MSEIKNYKIEFVERTKDLLNDNFSDFKNKNKEVTFLLNCLLGLIVIVSENEKKSNLTFNGKIDDDFLLNLPEKIGFTIKDSSKNNLTDGNLTQIITKIGHKNDLKKHNKIWFVNKLRNGIAHQNIEGINDNGNWIGLKLWNTNNNSTDFEIVFTIDELKKLALKIAEDYLLSTRSNKQQKENAKQ
jgi:hypothetical protein